MHGSQSEDISRKVKFALVSLKISKVISSIPGLATIIAYVHEIIAIYPIPLNPAGCENKWNVHSVLIMLGCHFGDKAVVGV